MNLRVLQASQVGIPISAIVEKDGHAWFPAVVIGKALGFADPAKHISTLYNRNIDELEPHSRLLKLRVHTNNQEVRYFSETGVWICGMLSRTPNAKKIRLFAAELITRLRKGNKHTKQDLQLMQMGAVKQLEKWIYVGLWSNESLKSLIEIDERKLLSNRQLARAFECSISHIKEDKRTYRIANGDFENRMPMSLKLYYGVLGNSNEEFV